LIVKRIVIVIMLLAIPIFGLAKTELAFWYAWGGDEGKVLLELVEEFNRSQSEIIVRPVFVPIGQGEKINTALAGSSTPDIVTIWDWMVVPLGESGALIPLNDYLDSAGIDESDYLPGVWSYGAYRGTKYGLPATLNAYAWVSKSTTLRIPFSCYQVFWLDQGDFFLFQYYLYAFVCSRF